MLRHFDDESNHILRQEAVMKSALREHEKPKAHRSQLIVEYMQARQTEGRCNRNRERPTIYLGK